MSRLRGGVGVVALTMSMVRLRRTSDHGYRRVSREVGLLTGVFAARAGSGAAISQGAALGRRRRSCPTRGTDSQAGPHRAAAAASTRGSHVRRLSGAPLVTPRSTSSADRWPEMTRRCSRRLRRARGSPGRLGPSHRGRLGAAVGVVLRLNGVMGPNGPNLGHAGTIADRGARRHRARSPLRFGWSPCWTRERSLAGRCARQACCRPGHRRRPGMAGRARAWQRPACASRIAGSRTCESSRRGDRHVMQPLAAGLTHPLRGHSRRRQRCCAAGRARHTRS